MDLADTKSSCCGQSFEHSPDDWMLYVPGGTYLMGPDRHYREKAPAHRVTVDGFWMDRTPITNSQFSKFVNATGYITFAEIAPEAAARHAEPIDTSASHVGFRCVTRKRIT